MTQTLSALRKTTESAYLLVTGYIRQFCGLFKLSHRINFDIQLIVITYYPPNYHVFGLQSVQSTNRLRFTKMEVFSLLCDDINEIWCNYDRYIIKTVLNEIYISQNYDASSSSSGFFQLPQKKHNRHNDYIHIVSDGKFGEHTIMVSKNNRFYGFGPNTSAQYGCGHTFTQKLSNDRGRGQIYALNALKRVFKGISLKQIKCGSHHTMFLTTTGRVYCCGEKKMGQIGIINNAKYCHQLEPTLVPFLYDIVEVDCGRKHNLCLDRNGCCWCFGFNENGQLGLPFAQYVDVPVVNKWFMRRNITITAIRCGYDFSLCIDHHGWAYLFGSNETGNIGNGRDFEYRVDVPFVLFSKGKRIRIRSASLGYNHTVLIDVNNNIWAFGANNNSQCSVNISSETNIVRPYHLERQEIGISRRRHIYKAIAGHSSTLIITSCVLVYDSSIYSKSM